MIGNKVKYSIFTILAIALVTPMAVLTIGQLVTGGWSLPALNPEAEKILLGNYDRSVGLAWAINTGDPQMVEVSIVAVYLRHNQIYLNEATAMILACAPPTNIDDVDIGICARLFDKNPKAMLSGLKQVLESGEIRIVDDGICEYIRRLVEDVPEVFQGIDEYAYVEQVLSECP